MSQRAAKRWLTLVLALIVWAGSAAVRAGELSDEQAEERGRTLEVSVLTFAPGEVYWQRFGHNALRVRNLRDGRSVVYNYGVFDFNQADFARNFALGKMRYVLQRERYDSAVALYRSEDRTVIEQVLALTPTQRARAHEFLEWNARPENAEYGYNYFTDNCSTRVRDVIDRVLGGQLSSAWTTQSTDSSYRSEATRLMAPAPALMLGLDFILGPYADRRLNRWEQGFVPARLSESLAQMHVSDGQGGTKPLVEVRRVVYLGSRGLPPEMPPDWKWTAAGFGIASACILMLFWRKLPKRRGKRLFLSLQWLWTGVLTGAGLLLLMVWGFTEHAAGWRNANLLLASPLSLCLTALPPSALRRGCSVLLAAGLTVGAGMALTTEATNGPLLWWLALAPSLMCLIYLKTREQARHVAQG